MISFVEALLKSRLQILIEDLEGAVDAALVLPVGFLLSICSSLGAFILAWSVDREDCGETIMSSLDAKPSPSSQP